jgi:hypothetical protein
MITALALKDSALQAWESIKVMQIREGCIRKATS